MTPDPKSKFDAIPLGPPIIPLSGPADPNFGKPASPKPQEVLFGAMPPAMPSAMAAAVSTTQTTPVSSAMMPAPAMAANIPFGTPAINTQASSTRKTTMDTKPTANIPQPVTTTTVTSASTQPANNSESMLDWFKSVLAPSKNLALFGVAVAGLVGGYYGVKTLFPPAKPAVASKDTTKEQLGNIESDLSKTNTSATTNNVLTQNIQPPSLPPIDLIGNMQPTNISNNQQNTGLTPLPEPNPFPPPIVQPANNSPTRFENEPNIKYFDQNVKQTGGQDVGIPSIPKIEPIDNKKTTPADPVNKPAAVNMDDPKRPNSTANTITPAVPNIPSMDAPKIETLNFNPLAANQKTPPTLSTGNSAISPINLPGIEKDTKPNQSIDLPKPGMVGNTGLTDLTKVDLPKNNQNVNPFEMPIPAPTTTSIPLPPPTPTTPIPINPIPTTPIPINPIANVNPQALPANNFPTITPVNTLSVAPANNMNPVANTNRQAETRTDIDVDLHYVKPGDSYESISKLHYGDGRYGQKLREFNAQYGSDQRYVQIPPFSMIKQGVAPAPVSRTIQNTNTVAPGSITPVSNSQMQSKPQSDVSWSAAPNTQNLSKFYVLTEPMTFRDLAKKGLGTEQDWKKIHDLNYTYESNATLQPGTRIKMPSSSILGN